MTALIPFAVHYLFEGVNHHFFQLAIHFTDLHAIHFAAIDACPRSSDRIELNTPRGLALSKAEALGITRIRWNVAL